jgi:hypothetical protein
VSEHRPGKRKAGRWWVTTPEQKASADPVSGRPSHIPARSFDFGKDRKRAKKFAGNIQGAKVRRSGFWSPGRVLFALIVIVVLIVIATH